jgi:UDP-N-acetylmuramate dehydrogenase
MGSLYAAKYRSLPILIIMTQNLLHQTSCPLIPRAPLREHTWLGVGGPADFLAQPQNQEQLLSLLNALEPSTPLHIIGAGSNLLVRDGGVKGVVLSLKGSWNYTRIDPLNPHILEVGAATTDMNTARAARNAGLSGLEFMIGIPGTIGGAIRMNAGCFKGETSQCLLDVSTLSRDGTFHTLYPDQLQFAYRQSQIPHDHIILKARFSLQHDDPELIQERMKVISKERQKNQPQAVKTSGSTFKNPTSSHLRAWQLIEGVGGRERSYGNAQFSHLHCNFLINNGNASAHELEHLALSVQKDVLNTSGIALEWEVIRWGLSQEETSQ